jgi:subtilisin family serine protease
MAGLLASSSARTSPAERSAEISETGRVSWFDTSDREPRSPLRHVPRELLVRFRRDVPRTTVVEALSRLPLAFDREFTSVPNLHHVRIATDTFLDQGLDTLRRRRDVEYVEPNYVMQASSIPDDPRFGEQWALRNTGQTGGTAGADIGAVAAWDLTTGSSGVAVAVIDTGIDYTHEDLAANVFHNVLDCDADGVDDDGNGYADDCRGIDVANGDSDPMDDEGHGTHVAGIIGAAGDNLRGVSGVSWGVTLLPCKFLDENGEGSTAGAVACLDYVARMRDRGLNVVATNNSWGGGLYSRALRDTIEAQQQRGILFVASAGNSRTDNDLKLAYPCSFEPSNILCVSATDDSDLPAFFSRYGRTTIHLAAPGDQILSTLPGNSYGLASGTSMAAPHVSGVAALLVAQDPTRDWRAVKNRILAGGQPVPSPEDTISGRRLSAAGALACSGVSVASRVRPSGAVLAGLGARVPLRFLSIDCSGPVEGVFVTVSPTGQSVPLADDGLEPDEVAGDGLFSGTWVPTSAGAFTLDFADGSVIPVTVDPHLRAGFPVKAYAGAGSFRGGAGLHTLVGDIDGDRELEILATALAQGPLYAWNPDGTSVPGWPAPDFGAAYPALGELSDAPGLEVLSAHYDAQDALVGRTGLGVLLPGWPRQSENFIGSPPTVANVLGYVFDQVFTEEEDWRLHGYAADGSVLPGWPTSGYVGGQQRDTPAIADLDRDGDLEVITVGGAYLCAHHHDATWVSGFPVRFSASWNNFPVIGDVDGDGDLEIVVGTRSGAVVFSASGVVERSLVAHGTDNYGTAAALADLTGDHVPEIIVQTDTALDVWRGDGTVLPGWPVRLGTATRLENAAPVVGDLDGDGQPEVVALSLPQGGLGIDGDVLIFDRNGVEQAHMRKRVAGLGSGFVPAIADLDGDGRNELIITSALWVGVSGYYDKVWVYGFGGPTPHGPVPWGQFMGGPGHRALYTGRAPFHGLAVQKAGGGSGTVTSSPAGIDCGRTCRTVVNDGTAVTLTATPTAPSLFTGWTGACTGTGVCELAMDAGKSVTASFHLVTPAVSFYTVDPCRVLDSREPAGPFAGVPLVAEEETIAVIAGRCGVPATAKAVAVNLTATGASGAGHLRMYPAGSGRPSTSTVNFHAGQTRANNGVVMLGANGNVALFPSQSSGTVHVVIDVTGYFE